MVITRRRLEADMYVTVAKSPHQLIRVNEKLNAVTVATEGIL